MGNKPLWLIVRQGCSGIVVFTTNDHLPIFSFRDEAEIFLHFESAGEGWHARETSCGELVSLLYGPCREVEHISLDPVPKIATIVSLRRKAFVKALLESEIPSAAAKSEMLVVAS
jgi:hypothetical protein